MVLFWMSGLFWHSICIVKKVHLLPWFLENFLYVPCSIKSQIVHIMTVQFWMHQALLLLTKQIYVCSEDMTEMFYRYALNYLWFEIELVFFCSKQYSCLVADLFLLVFSVASSPCPDFYFGRTLGFVGLYIYLW